MKPLFLKGRHIPVRYANAAGRWCWLLLAVFPACSRDAEEPDAVTTPFIEPRSATLTSAGSTAMFRAVLAVSPPPTITWRSADPIIASIDATGKAVALRPGTTWIIAVAGELRDSVTVIIDLSGEWATIDDWSTSLGDNGHRSFVPVTLDHRHFHRLWSSVFFGDSAVQSVATGMGMVFATSGGRFTSQEVAALSIESGTTRWIRRLGELYALGEPGYHSGRVYFASGGHEDAFIWALDAATGQTVWQTPYGDQFSRYQAPVFGTALLYSPSGYYGGVAAYDLMTGTERWFAGYQQGTDAWTPAVDGGIVYAFDQDYDPALGAYSEATGSRLYTVHLAVPTTLVRTTPVVSGRCVLGIHEYSSPLFCIDRQTHRVAWYSERTYTGPIVATDSAVYVYGAGGLDKIDLETGAVLWRSALRAAPNRLTSLLGVRNYVFVSYAGRIEALDAATGDVQWSTSDDGSLSMSREGILLVASTLRAKGLVAYDLRQAAR